MSRLPLRPRHPGLVHTYPKTSQLEMIAGFMKQIKASGVSILTVSLFMRWTFPENLTVSM